MEIATPREVKLKAIEATPESFAPFGQVIASSPDGDEFGPHDAQLDLSRGIPRSLSHSLADTKHTQRKTTQISNSMRVYNILNEEIAKFPCFNVMKLYRDNRFTSSNVVSSTDGQ
jgi:hypothetical protein